jgi:hypothetical protein
MVYFFLFFDIVIELTWKTQLSLALVTFKSDYFNSHSSFITKGNLSLSYC